MCSHRDCQFDPDEGLSNLIFGVVERLLELSEEDRSYILAVIGDLVSRSSTPAPLPSPHSTDVCGLARWYEDGGR